MGAVRLEIRLNSQSEWIKIFDPRDWTVFVPNEALPSGEDADVDNGATLRIDLTVGGWVVALNGTVVGTREDPDGIVVAVAGTEREKINYLNGFVRGGLLNLRRKNRLPIKLSVTYGAIEGPEKTFTKDINEEGVFLFTDKPLPETSQVHMLVSVPGKQQPLSLMGRVSHTILAQDEEPPGMGIVFDLDEAQREHLQSVIKELEEQLEKNQLPDPLVE